MKFGKTLVSITAIAAAFLVSSSAMALEQGDWLVRGRIINISPNVTTNDEIDIDSAVTLDIDFTYMFNSNFGMEILLAIPATHDVKGTESIASLGKIAEVTVLPPALIAQYYFMPQNNIRPYVGAGINYTFIYDESTTSSLTNGLGVGSTGLDVDDTFGYLVQAGVDFDIDKNWFVNIDAKYFWIDTEATVQVDGADAGTIKFDLDPLVLGVGAGYRF
jgi:outer membrane protein